MVLIFTDFPTGSGSSAHAVLEICKYQSHPWVNWESSNADRGHHYIKYSCARLFLLYIICFLYFLCFKFCSLIDTQKPKGIFWLPQNHTYFLNFLQGATESLLICPSKMDIIGLYGGVHSNDNSNDVIIKWVLCPIVVVMVMTLKINIVAIAVWTSFKGFSILATDWRRNWKKRK